MIVRHFVEHSLGTRRSWLPKPGQSSFDVFCSAQVQSKLHAIALDARPTIDPSAPLDLLREKTILWDGRKTIICGGAPEMGHGYHLENARRIMPVTVGDDVSARPSCIDFCLI